MHTNKNNSTLLKLLNQLQCSQQSAQTPSCAKTPKYVENITKSVENSKCQFPVIHAIIDNMNQKVSTTPTFSTHLLQSKEWQKYEELEGHQTIRLEGKNYALTAVLHETPLLNYLYVPYGPSASNKTALLNALKALKRFAESKNISFIRIEPTLALGAPEMAKIAKKLGLKCQKSHDLDPAHTWILDLNTNQEDLLKNMESRKVRYWRNHEKKGMKIRTTKDPSEITILTDLLKNLGEIDNFTPQTETHLKNQLKSGFATLYIIELQREDSEPSSEGGESGDTTLSSSGALRRLQPSDRGRAPMTTGDANPGATEDSSISDSNPIAAALIYDHDETRYYAHAATDFTHRKLAAGSILLIQMILDAKESGKKFYDFWGITISNDKNHPWYGFTQYKKSFGGRQVDYTGTYDLILHPFKYNLYSLLRKINRSLRKIHKN